MKKNSLKLIVLFSLIIFSLYQTTRLWFDDLSDLNLFYDIINSNGIEENDVLSERSYFVQPETIAIYLLSAEKNYSVIQKNKLDFDDISRKSIDILKSIIQNGELVQESISLDILWEKRHILLKYNFEITSSQLLEDLNIKDLAFTRSISEFNEIIIQPNFNQEEYTYVYFINKDYSQIKAFRMKNKYNEINKSLEKVIKQLEDKKEGFPTYVSSKNLKIEWFKNNILLPGPRTEMINSAVVKTKKIKPFYNDGEIDSSKLENYVNGFFANSYKWKIEKQDDHWTYSDESVFLNYNTDGVIEYVNDNINNKKDLTIIDSYYVANKFLEKDNKIVDQEYYLANYKVNGNEVKFNYNYKCRDIKMIISDDYLEKYHMKYPMEITVVDGQVKTYKRLLLELESDEYTIQGEKSNISYNTVLDKFLETYQEEKNDLQQMELIYYLPSRDEDLTLKWMINNKIFVNQN
ncbi:MAG: hypothetical protein N4A50_02075 [Vallitalea sp.]|jgi:hypothetical protein|nr:hypothetical protein [Vallitalea sp.]